MKNTTKAEGGKKPKTKTAEAFAIAHAMLSTSTPSTMGDFSISLTAMIKGCGTSAELKHTLRACKRALIAGQQFDAAAVVRDALVKAGWQ